MPYTWVEKNPGGSRQQLKKNRKSRLAGKGVLLMRRRGGFILMVYFGAAERPNAIHTLAKAGGKRVMISFAEPPRISCWKLYREYGMEIIADSGAFSMWKRGIDLQIEDYMNWITENDIQQHFNLDVVGDPETTARNQVKMEQAGFNPIPVFHFGEPIELLAELVENYPLVGLGGTVGQPTTVKEQWFRQVFSLYPQGNFHALGVANTRLLMQFPFVSVDSVWWVYKFRDKQVRMSPGNDRKDEQRARVKHLLGLENNKPTYQAAMF